MRTLRLAAAAAAVVVMAAPGLAAAETATTAVPATIKAQSAKVQRLTAAVDMTKQDRAARAFSGPSSMLADPTNPRIIVAAVSDLRSRVCYLLRSENAGKTWQIMPALPTLSSYPYCTSTSGGVPQSAIAWGRDHTLYYGMNGYSGSEGGSNGDTSILLARSTNFGASWTTTLVDNNRGKTGPTAPNDSGVRTVAVDTSGPTDRVYVGFSQSYPNAPTGSPLKNSAVMVAASSNGGTTFGTPVNIASFSQVNVPILGSPYPLIPSGAPFMVAHDGVVIAVTGSTTLSGAPPPGGVALSGGINPQPLLVSRSSNAGQTWSVQTLSPSIYTGEGSDAGIGWSPVGGAQGSFVVAYSAAPSTAPTSGVNNIWFQRSTDGGSTWSSPVIVDTDNSAGLGTDFYPMLGVAPNGRIDVIWEDNDGQSNYHFQVGYTYSSDGGSTWASTVQVSDQPINFNLGVSVNSDIRQPAGVASANQYALFGWADSRLADATNQNQDDFGDAAQFAGLPAVTSPVVSVLAAAFGGLVVLGLILIVVALVRRRPSGPTPPAVEHVDQPVGTA